MSRRQEHHPNSDQPPVQQTAVKNVQVGGNFTIETITQNITQIVIKETGDRPTKVIKIDWRAVCHQVLTQQQKNQRLRRKATELGFELNVYVPLGLVERKQQQRRSVSDDVEREEVYQLSEEVITKEYKHDAFLKEVIGVNSTKHVAIVGEPGAGKTTLLTKIADWIDKNEKGLPIYISLANLQKKSLEDYLLKFWLDEALNFIDPEARVYQDAVKESLKERFRGGGVWLLLDGLDEMAVSSSSSALAEIQRQLSGWVGQARVALTSRLNVWDFSLNNPLANFETYRTLEFSQEQVEQFIKEWFAAANNELELLGTQLQAKLEESQYQRVRELVKNPLRLALLCQTWYYNQGELPETRAGLYQRFVFYFPQWRVPEYLHSLRDDEKDDLIDELNIALGKLAKEAIDSPNRFRLPKNFCRQQMKLSSQEIVNKQDISLFQLARDFGWLNLVDRDRETEEEVYAFFHPSFQEYFAATAIDDWHFFLNHIPKNPLQGTYRIFEPQWQEVILLWLGQSEENQPRQQKEAFIKALVEFEDGCGEWFSQERVDKGFYEYRAYFLAAAGIAEFGDCSRADEIVKQIVQWGCGYLDEKQEQQEFLILVEWGYDDLDAKGNQQKFLGHIKWGAQKALQETERTKAIAALVELIDSATDTKTRRQAAKSLGAIGVGNEQAIAALVELIDSTNDTKTRRQAAKSLGQVNPGNEKAIAALVELIDSATDTNTRRQAAKSLGAIGVGNEQAIAALVELIDSTTDTNTRRQAAESLGQVNPGNEKAIAALVELIDSTTDTKTRMQALWSLEAIGVGNEQAIAALMELIDSATVEPTRIPIAIEVAFTLETIDPGNQKAAALDIPSGVEQEKALKEKGIAAALMESIDSKLVELLGSTQDESTRSGAAESLGKIGTGNETAIAALVKLLGSTEDESTRSGAAESLRHLWLPHNFAQVVAASKDFLNDSQRFNEEFYGVIWDCAQNMSYPAFYQAWHEDSLDTSATQSLDLADLPRILTEEIAKDTELQDKVQLICIDGSKILDKDNPALEIYDQMLDYDCSERPNGEPETMPKLKLYWHSLQRNSNKLVVMVFYDSTALEPEWAGFSQSLLDALTTFKGAICVVTEQPVGNLKQFSFREPYLVENLVEWITSHHLD